MPSNQRPKPGDDAAITRELRTDSEALRYAEWWVRRKIYGLSDEEARFLLRLYRDAYQRMLDPLANAYDSNGKPILSRRLATLEQIEREMDALLRQVNQHAFDSAVQAYQMGLYGRGWALDAATSAGVPVRVPLLPIEAIRAAVLQPYLGQRWGETLLLERDEFVLRIRRSITNSLISGEGMQAAQRRLRDELGIQTDRRKGFTRNFYRTQLIARNEIMRASNQGALAVYEQNQDILQGWEFVATKDGRTCKDICGPLDGKTFLFSDPMSQPPSGTHPGCRCTVVPWLKDTRIADLVMGGPRQTYTQWAAQRGITDDGGLSRQRGADVPELNKA